MCAATTPCRSAPETAALGVPVEHVVQQRAGRGLPALVQPQPGHHGAEVGPPDAGDGSRLGDDRHVAGRGAGDQRQPAGRGPRREVAPSRPSPPAWASIRPTPTAIAGSRPSSAARGARRAGRRRAPIGAAWSGSAQLRQQLRRGRSREEVGLPARALVVEIGPLAGDGAGRGGDPPRSPARSGNRRGPSARPKRVPGAPEVALEPQQLGQLHLGRHDAADVVERRGARSR